MTLSQLEEISERIKQASELNEGMEKTSLLLEYYRALVIIENDLREERTEQDDLILNAALDLMADIENEI